MKDDINESYGNRTFIKYVGKEFMEELGVLDSHSKEDDDTRKHNKDAITIMDQPRMSYKEAIWKNKKNETLEKIL